MSTSKYGLSCPNGQHPESLDSAGIEAIAKGINARRLATCRQAVDSDVAALVLYGLNARLSGLLLETVGGFEVVLRNAVSEALADHFRRPDWYRTRAFTGKLDDHRRRNIRAVRKELKAHGRKCRLRFWVPFLRTGPMAHRK